MNAQEARELFSAALENELAAEQRSVFEAALAREPELAAEYAAFVAMVTRVRSEGELPAAPDLLPRVQRRLRARSRGRFYADRYAERLGSGLLQPLPLAIAMLMLIALAWVVLLALGVVALPPTTG